MQNIVTKQFSLIRENSIKRKLLKHKYLPLIDKVSLQTRTARLLLPHGGAAEGLKEQC
jgi:hypothetical protein